MEKQVQFTTYEKVPKSGEYTVCDHYGNALGTIFLTEGAGFPPALDSFNLFESI
jgi:hypothetical protein